MGLGLLGRSAGDAEFLAQCGAKVTVTDMKSGAQLQDSVARLSRFQDIAFHLGGHVEEDFTTCDMVIKAAGVPLDSPYIAAARKAGVPVYMSTALFAQFAQHVGVRIVGVTGTRGKSTVTQMIYEALKNAGKEVLLGGNVRGVSTLAQLPQLSAQTIAVLELDSWQLQGFGDLGISPNVSVFTNLMSDHLNYYGGDMEAYFSDKANIFKNQKDGDVLVVGDQIADRVKAAHPPIAPIVPPVLPSEWQMQVPGEHNRSNAALAKAALESLGIDAHVIQKSLESFAGVEGRLQFVREIDDVKIYNDNNATTPDATIAALRALSADRQDSNKGSKNIVLIMGGADKNLDMNNLLYEIAGVCKRVILLAGSGSNRVAPLMQDVSVYDDLSAAVYEAVSSAAPGDVVLFSPAFASFGMFANEYDRNDQFMKIVQSIV